MQFRIEIDHQFMDDDGQDVWESSINKYWDGPKLLKLGFAIHNIVEKLLLRKHIKIFKK